MLFSILLSGSIWSDSVNSITTNSALVIGLSASPTWISGNETQTLNLQSDITKTYTASQPNNTIPNFELFVGTQRPIQTRFNSQPFMGQLGLVVAVTGKTTLSGDIWEDADPNFNNSTYQYNVNHVLLGLKGRLIANYGHCVEPYLSAGLGIGFNRAYGFSISPNISEEVASPLFRSNSTTTFSYTLGIGLQKALNNNFQVAIGYEFSDWGKSSLFPAAGQTTNNAPTLDHLYAQTLLLSLFYV